MEEALPVRCRVVLEVTFPDADRYNSSGYRDYLNALLEAVRNAEMIKCSDVIMRAAATIGPSEENEEWSGGPTFDFGSLTPSAGEIFSFGGDPVPSVDPRHIASVWHVLSKAERRELAQNVSIAVGQVLGPEVNANAVLARVYILRVLQKAGHLRNDGSKELFEKAASLPLEHPPTESSDLAGYAALFD